MKKKSLLSILFVLVCAAGPASFVHPFGDVKNARSSVPLLAGAPVPSAVKGIVSKSCQNCHSEKTEWPFYSFVAPLSWMVEKDVHDARSHMNLSHWNDYDADYRIQILSQIGSLVRNHQMPPQRYLLLHPEARLSDTDTDQLYQWTRSERRRLKTVHPIVDQD